MSEKRAYSTVRAHNSTHYVTVSEDGRLVLHMEGETHQTLLKLDDVLKTPRGRPLTLGACFAAAVTWDSEPQYLIKWLTGNYVTRVTKSALQNLAK